MGNEATGEKVLGIGKASMLMPRVIGIMIFRIEHTPFDSFANSAASPVLARLSREDPNDNHAEKKDNHS
jgi:hypothetical protein